MPKISVIVPVYNGADYLSRCLDSLFSQTLQDIEIILVDDGSVDNSARICADAANSDMRVKFIPCSHAGLVSTRKIGLRNAKADYVLYVDCDDWLEPEACHVLYEAATYDNADLVMGGHFREGKCVSKEQHPALSEGNYDRARIEGEILPRLFHNDFQDEWTVYPYLWGKLFRRAMLLPCQEQVSNDIGLAEDACVTFPLIVQCRSLSVAPDALYHYVQHAQSMVHNVLDEKSDLSRIKKLHRIVSASLRDYSCGGDLLQQWRCYLLTTILLPRLPGILLDEELDVFSVGRSLRGKKVVVYGAGTFGIAMHNYVVRKNFAEVVLWLDARAAILREEGLNVKSLGEVESWPDFDYVLVAVINRKITDCIMQELLASGVPKGKIGRLSESFATSENVWNAFKMESVDGK